MRCLSIIIISLFCSIFTPVISAQAAGYSPVTLTIVAPNGTPLPGVTVITPGRTGVSGTPDYGQSNLQGQVAINDRAVGETLQLEISPRPYIDGGGWQCPSAMSPVKQITVSPNNTNVTVQIDSTIDQVDHPELSAEEQSFIDLVNSARAQLGRNPVHEVARFTQLASVEAAAFDIYKDRISTAKHLGLQCEGLQTRETEGGIHIDPAQSYTSEVTAYASSAQVALADFKGEPLHWDTLMRADITDIGVALVNGRSFVADVGNGKYTITGPDLVHHRTLPAWSTGGSTGTGTGKGTGTTTDPGDALSVDRPDTTVVGHRVQVTGSSTASSVTVTYNGQQQTVKVDSDQTWSATVKAVQTGTVTATDTTGSASAKLQVRASIKLHLHRNGHRYTLTGTVTPHSTARVTITRSGHHRTVKTNRQGTFRVHFTSKHRPRVRAKVVATTQYLSTARSV